MATGTVWLLAAAALTLFVGPLVLGLMGVVSVRGVASERTTAGSWRATAVSALFYTLAFNLTFFIQELFLVLPKALTPGLRPTLYHNNHSWEGTNPLASLFQGTGALATLMVGLLCMSWLRHLRPQSDGSRLFLFWMAYCGCFMALPQLVIGALSQGSDLGMAMNYLQIGEAARLCVGLLALVLMPMIALLFCRPALELATQSAQIAGPAGHTRTVFRLVTLPALIGSTLVIPFRIPRELLEVVIVPVMVILAGIPWIQAGAWRARAATSCGTASRISLAYPLAAVVMLLLIFQFVLRPGIRFY